MAPGQPFMHRTFKEIKIHTAKCDQCNKHNSATIYRCEDCSEQCCTPCWNQQGEDGKHLLNNALTVIIPASEAEKRRRTKKKPTKVVKKGKNAINNKKVEKRPVKRKIVEDDDLDHTGDEFAAAANKTRRVDKKQTKKGLQIADLYEDSSDPVIEVGPMSHSRDTKRQAMKAVGDRRLANRAVKGPAPGSKERVHGKNVVLVQGEDTTDDDLPVLHIPLKATPNIKKEFPKVGNANKRKRSEPTLEDQNTSGHHYVASSRKKARTCTPRKTGYAVDASSRPQAPSDTEETEADIREHAKNLLLFAQGVQHSSPTPSPPITKTADSADAKANTRSDLTGSNTARSPSPFADLPVWPPAATPTTAAVTSTFPPSRDYYERAAARQAQTQACKAPAPRQGMWNRTWFPSDADDRAEANAEYHAGVESALAATNDAEPATTITKAAPGDKTLNQEPDLNNDAALQQKKTRDAVADDAYQRKAHGQTTNKEVVVFEVVETVTKTPLRKGIAHVKSATPRSRTLEVFSA